MGHRVWYLCVHIFVWYVPKEFPSHFVNHKRMFTFCAEVICSINDTFMTMISFFWHSLSCVQCDVTITNILMLHKFDITREAPCEKRHVRNTWKAWYMANQGEHLTLHMTLFILGVILMWNIRNKKQKLMLNYVSWSDFIKVYIQWQLYDHNLSCILWFYVLEISQKQPNW